MSMRSSDTYGGARKRRLVVYCMCQLRQASEWVRLGNTLCSLVQVVTDAQAPGIECNPGIVQDWGEQIIGSRKAKSETGPGSQGEGGRAIMLAPATLEKASDV